MPTVYRVASKSVRMPRQHAISFAVLDVQHHSIKLVSPWCLCWFSLYHCIDNIQIIVGCIFAIRLFAPRHSILACLYIGAFAHIDDVFFLALLLHTCPLNLNSRSAGHNLEEPNCTERLYKPTKYNSSLFDCVHSYFTALRAKTKHARLPFVKPPVAAKIQKGAAYGCPRNFSPMIF